MFYILLGKEVSIGYHIGEGDARMHLAYRQKANGMYILRKEDFEDIATNVLREYAPQVLQTPRPLDVEYFMLECLYLDIKKCFITPNGSVMGMIAMEDTYCPEWRGQGPQAEFLPAGTVVIDASLCGLEQKPRCRFTEAHEASHWLLHRSFHSSDKREFSFRTDWRKIACRSSTIERFSWKHDHAWTDNDWEEWQADSLAAALLMPGDSFREAVETAMRHQGIRQRYLVKGEKVYEANCVINEVANLFGVSRKATQIRMSQFCMIRESWLDKSQRGYMRG